MTHPLENLLNRVAYPYPTLEAYLNENLTSSLSLAYVHQGVITTKTVCLKELFSEHTRFQVASISKLVFAALLFDQHTQRNIDLTHDIRPDISRLGIPLYDAKKPFTMLDLLSHTAGFNLHGFAGYEPHQRHPSLKAMLQGEAPTNHPKLRQEASPKTAFRYSGGGYQLAQWLFEEHQEISLKEASQRFFKKLGMPHSVYNALAPRNILSAYSAHNTPLKDGYIRYPELAAAGLWTTPTDLARLGIALLQAYHKEAGPLNAHAFQTMFKKPENIQTPCAHGVFIEDHAKGQFFGHGGNSVGYHSAMIFDTASKEGVVVMVNSDLADHIPRTIADAFKAMHQGEAS